MKPEVYFGIVCDSAEDHTALRVGNPFYSKGHGVKPRGEPISSLLFSSSSSLLLFLSSLLFSRRLGSPRDESEARTIESSWRFFESQVAVEASRPRVSVGKMSMARQTRPREPSDPESKMSNRLHCIYIHRDF
jgi:hypothetical protein